jgi:hypothetical protein
MKSTVSQIETTAEEFSAKAACKPTLPITIAEWPRTDDEVVRLMIVRFRGQDRLDLRIWCALANGDQPADEARRSDSSRAVVEAAESLAPREGAG